MVGALDMPQQVIELDELFPRLEQLLVPPLSRSADERGRPAVRGLHAGKPTTIRLDPVIVDYIDDGTSSLELEVEGRTFDLDCTVTPPAVLNRTGALLGDPDFDQRFDVCGAPQSVLNQVFGPETRAHMKQNPCWVRFAPDRVVISLGTRARSLESVAVQLSFAASLLDKLPEAIRAAGAGRFLELGSLATHPEVVARAQHQRSRRKMFLGILAIILSATLLVAIVVVLIITLVIGGTAVFGV